MSFIRIPFHLDELPENRWSRVFADLRFQHAISSLQKFLDHLKQLLTRKKLHLLLRLVAKRYRSALQHKYPDYLRELNGLCRLLQTSCDLLLLLQFMYEFGATCTSIIFSNAQKENIHFRTLDWSIPVLRDCTVCLDVFSQGTLLYSNLTFLGYIGLYTGQKPNVFSLSLNYRSLHHDHKHSLVSSVILVIKNLLRPFRNYELNGLCLRQAVEQCMSYEEIVQRLKVVPLSAACYLMVCGAQPDQGIRIVRDYKEASTYPFTPWSILKHQDPNVIWTAQDELFWTYHYPSYETLSNQNQNQNQNQKQQEQPKFLIQTNMDPAKFDFLQRNPGVTSQGILYSFDRWKQACEAFQGKQNFWDEILPQLCRYPILNEKTIFWCVMEPGKSLIHGETMPTFKKSV